MIEASWQYFGYPLQMQTLKSINQHCHDLARCLNDILPTDGLLKSSEWLEIAAAIQSVNLDLVRFDECFGWCSGADAYQLARQQILRKHVTHLSVFMFVWGALEAAIEDISPPPHPDKSKQGKINSACHYISRYFCGRMMIASYNDAIKEFSALTSNSSSYERISEELRLPAHIGAEAFGLFIVYKLRNELAHGSMKFPIPDEEHRPISPDPKIVELATRIVLFSIQMLYLARYAEENLMVDRPLSYGGGEVPLNEWLRVIHYGKNPDSMSD